MTSLRPLVIVLGMHRSGTSLCANLLAALGVDMAEAPGAAPSNRRGHWERPRINDLHDSILAIFGRAWADPSHHLALPDGWWTDPRVRPIRDQLLAWLGPRFAASPCFGFKDPRTARLLALWPEILAELGAAPVYVFCLREPAQVVRSLVARDAASPEESEYRWLIYNLAAVHGVGPAPVCVIPYEDWFDAGPQAASGMLARLAKTVLPAHPADPAALSRLAGSIVDSELRHDAAGIAAVPRPVCAELHRRIRASAVEGRFPPELTEHARAMLSFEQAATPLLRDSVVLRVGMAQQARVIGDLNGLIGALRRKAA